MTGLNLLKNLNLKVGSKMGKDAMTFILICAVVIGFIKGIFPSNGE